MPKSYVCPVCSARSHNPTDIEMGYCGACHDFTRDVVIGTVKAGEITMKLGEVNRVTYHADGRTPESDTTHTVMLGLIACALADRWRDQLQLDLGRVAAFALVHELPEAYAGDVNTLRMLTPEQKERKKENERLAAARIAKETQGLPWISDTLGLYEAQELPEARFVRALDKLLPKITHALNGLVTVRETGFTAADLIARYDAQLEELREYAADFPPLFALREHLIELVLANIHLLPVENA